MMFVLPICLHKHWLRKRPRILQMNQQKQFFVIMWFVRAWLGIFKQRRKALMWEKWQIVNWILFADAKLSNYGIGVGWKPRNSGLSTTQCCYSFQRHTSGIFAGLRHIGCKATYWHSCNQSSIERLGQHNAPYIIACTCKWNGSTIQEGVICTWDNISYANRIFVDCLQEARVSKRNWDPLSVVLLSKYYWRTVDTLSFAILCQWAVLSWVTVLPGASLWHSVTSTWTCTK